MVNFNPRCSFIRRRIFISLEIPQRRANLRSKLTKSIYVILGKEGTVRIKNIWTIYKTPRTVRRVRLVRFIDIRVLYLWQSKPKNGSMQKSHQRWERSRAEIRVLSEKDEWNHAVHMVLSGLCLQLDETIRRCQSSDELVKITYKYSNQLLVVTSIRLKRKPNHQVNNG